MEDKNTTHRESCFLCGKNEDQVVLLQARKEGDVFWVCVRCLPILIHG